MEAAERELPAAIRDLGIFFSGQDKATKPTGRVLTRVSRYEQNLV